MSLEPVVAQHMREKCKELRNEIAEITAFFDLPRHHWYDRRIIVGEMASAWVNLEEIRPNRLHRYGAVDPTLTETLTPRLERLSQLVRVIQNLASRGG
jgi:hypothetical protein